MVGWKELEQREALVTHSMSKARKRKQQQRKSHNNRPRSQWAHTESALVDYVSQLRTSTFEVYAADPRRVLSDAKGEWARAEGGYAHRQVVELLQNAIDALDGVDGRVELILDGDCFYCANSGGPFTKGGIDGITSEYLGTSEFDDSKIGQFGLGFRSLVALSTDVDIFSRSISLGFELDHNHRDVMDLDLGDDVRQKIQGERDVALFRLPLLRDHDVAFSEDALLAGISTWAATVIRVRLRDDEAIADVSAQLEGLDGRISLFSPNLSQFRVRTNSDDRSFQIKRSGDHAVEISDGNETSKWRVFRTEQYAPSMEAKADAGAQAARDHVDLTWALPTPVPKADGAMWLFFPTQWTLNTKGIVNAPWKSDDSRQLPLDGKWNRELIDRSALLISESLPRIGARSEPSRALAVLPTPPSVEAHDTLDNLLSRRIYQLARQVPFLPAADGSLSIPTILHRPPADVPRDVVLTWYEAGSCDKSEWIHPALLKGSNDKLNRIGSPRCDSLEEWIALMDPGSSPQASIDALTVLLGLIETGSSAAKRKYSAADLKTLPCILTADGLGLLPPDPNQVFLSSVGDDTPGSRLVHPEVTENPEATRALKAFGIRPAGAHSALVVFLGEGWPEDNDADRWNEFWRLGALATTDEFTSALERFEYQTVRVMTVAGRLVSVNQALLEGRIAKATEDPDAVIDIDWHHHAEEHLRAVGAREFPHRVNRSSNDIANRQKTQLISNYERHAKREFYSTPGYLGHRARDGYDNLQYELLIEPLEVLSRLEPASAARFTRAVLDKLPEPQPWRVDHATTPQNYPTTYYPALEVHVLRAHGRINSSLGNRPFGSVVASGMATVEKLLPVVEMSKNSAKAYQVPWSWNEIRSKHLEHAWGLHLPDDPSIAVELVIEAVRHDVRRPARIPAIQNGQWCLCKTDDVVVAQAPATASLISQEVPYLLLLTGSHCEEVSEAWDLPLHHDSPDEPYGLEIDPEGPPTTIAVRYPWLVGIVDGAHEIEIVGCKEIRIYASDQPDEVTHTSSVFHQGTWYYDSGAVSTDDEVITALLGDLGLNEYIELAHDRRIEVEEQIEFDRVARARAADTDAGKLEALFTREALERELGSSVAHKLKNVLGHELSDTDIATALLAIRGDAVLRPLMTSLKYIDTPRQFSGGRMAREFVSMLALKPRYAGEPRHAEPTTITIPGPPNLPPLQDFQEDLVSDAAQLIKHGGRGILWLPTGAGKTRVAMQALVDSARAGFSRWPVIWIAEREELCEQAISALQVIWGAIGPEHAVTVSRLWGGRPVTNHEGPHIVVGTIQTLRSAIDKPEYTWLRSTGCVIIDEAHRSITDSYQELAKLGMSADVALFGLTATPFRGNDPAQTHRLAKQYDYELLEARELLPNPVEALQNRGVLSVVDHRSIEGAAIELTDDELSHLERFSDPSPSLANRLAADDRRNQRLIKTILALDPEWPILVFALSVDHAEFLAAALQISDRPARAISGATEHFARTSTINEFRSGNIKVLTNYQVFAEGFDAPKTRAIIIARPTFSPNLYQQMIGRGLRGPKNGGTAECLILDVNDNLARYKRQPVFTHFRRLFRTTDEATQT